MFRVFVCVIMIAAATASPAKPTLWNDGAVAEMRSLCNNDKDSFSCMKLKIVDFIETVMRKDNFKITDDIEIKQNGYQATSEGRSDRDIFTKIEDYLQSHDVSVNIPAAGAKVTVSPSEEEFNVKVNFASSGRSVEGEKSMIKNYMISVVLFAILTSSLHAYQQLVNQS